MRHGVSPGDKVAILSANDPVAFTCVFGISRAGAVWCPVNPRNEAAENRELLDLFDCSALIFQAHFAPLVEKIRHELPKLTTLVCLDGEADGAADAGTASSGRAPTSRSTRSAVDDLAMIVGTGGTTGRPKGVMLTGTNLETMTALTLMSYPFEGRPVYLALAPLTHAAGVLCFPVLALGGEIVVMRTPDVGALPGLVERHRVTHTFLPPTLVYMVLEHAALDTTDRSSLQCFWYGAAPMSAARLEEALTPDRPGHGPALRADRGADDDLDDGAARPLPAGRLGRPRSAVVGRASDSAGDGRRDGRGRHPARRPASAARSWSAARW